VHLENGKCSSEELYKIIEKTNPEIIFEEFDISRTEDEYYRNGHYKRQDTCTIETAAIMKYLQHHQIVHIPVDTYVITDNQQKDIEYMYNKLLRSNTEYYNLSTMPYIFSSQQGFSYFNSQECKELFEKIHIVEEKTVKSMNDEMLLNTYKLWQLITDNRENEMLKNIYDYSANHSYSNAIFVIGAEHRKSIIAKIQEYEKNGGLSLNWNYSNYDSIL
jgi:pheromone shutdown protein TraB